MRRLSLWYSSTEWYCRKDESHYYGEGEEYVVKFWIGKIFGQKQ
jgi:hypothetical protein